MNDQEIIIAVNQAINDLYESDIWLLRHDLSEQSISHKLAEKIQSIVPGYNIDCEYNGNIED